MSPVAPSRTRKRDTVTQTTPYILLHKHTARDKHMGDTQPLQYIDCTTGQAHCTVVGMEIRQSNPTLKKKTKHYSTDARPFH